jgi:hypothetical protein
VQIPVRSEFEGLNSVNLQEFYFYSDGHVRVGVRDPFPMKMPMVILVLAAMAGTVRAQEGHNAFKVHPYIRRGDLAAHTKSAAITGSCRHR